MRCTDDPNAYTNIAEISGSTDHTTGLPGEDKDSDDDFDPDNDGDPYDNESENPEDEDDHDPETIPIYDLALAKTLATEGPYNYGDLLTFEIEVINQGNMDAYNVVVGDYLPAGYSFNPTLNPGWTGTGSFVQDTISFLGVGATETLETIVELVQTTGGAEDWYNEAEINSFEDEDGDEQEDIDSTPDDDPDNDNDVELDSDEDDQTDGDSTNGGDEDDNDPAGMDVFDLALRKVAVTGGPYSFGDVITYNIEVYNQGSITATNIMISETLPCGLSYQTSNEEFGHIMSYNYCFDNYCRPVRPW